MKRMLLVWGCIFALGFLSCGSDDNDDDDNISILVNGAETVSAVEAGQSVLLRLSNGISAAWSVSDSSVATLSAESGVSVNLAAQTAGSVTVTATAGGRHYTRALQITAQSSDPNGGTANAPNVTFINQSAYKVVVCRDGLSAELATVAPGATNSVYVAPGTTEITFHFRYSYCVLDDTDSGMVWLDVSDSTAYTYPVDSADIASDTVQVRIPAPKNPQFNAAYLKVANQSDAPISLYNGNTQQKVYGQEKYYIQPGHSGVYAIPPDAPFDGFKLGATPASATPVTPFYAVSGVLYACVFSADDDSVMATEENWLRESFTVSFETNGGSAIPPLTASLLEATLIPATTREGYYFGGWHTDPELQRAATFPRVMTADTTLYAKWLENTNTAYTVRHFLQNTDRSTYTLQDTEPQTGTTGAATIAAAKAYRGFAAQPFAQETIAADGTTVIDIYYDRNAYTVTFDANDGTGRTQTQTCYYGVPQPLKPNTFTNPDYTFIGWAVSATDNPVYDNQADLLIDGDTPSGITLYAAWFYTVTAATAGSIDLASIQPDTYSIKVKGDITQDTLAVLADKMKSSTAASITLDMTEATGLTAITGNGYTSLFADCPLNSVALPKKLETIGDYAFAQCGITSVTIPASVKTIGEYAFGKCSNLQSAEIDGAETIGASTFMNCTNITSVTLKSVGSIGNEAFLLCNKLESVKIDGVETIGECAFWNCSNLKSLVLKSVTTIENDAFLGCGKLESVEINGAETIGARVFAGCTSMTTVTAESVGTIEANAFPSSLQSLVIKSVKSINDSAFANCTNLKSATIESADDLTITADTFKNCKQLATLTLKSVGSIGESAFHSHSSLSSVVIESVKSIGDDAFLGCKNLTTVSIKSVDTIGTNRNYVFSRCEKLSSVTMESVGTIGRNTFSYCTGLLSVTMKQVGLIGESAFLECNTLTSVIMESVGSIDGFAFWKCSSLPSVSLDITGSIGIYAFEDCTSLSSVTINAENINAYMFKNCTSLTTVTIGKRVSEIKNMSFSGCTKLMSVVFEDTEKWWYGFSNQKTYIDVTDTATNASNLQSMTSNWYKE